MKYFQFFMSISERCKATVPSLHKVYLASLHEKVQEWKDTIFNGNWPSSLLVIVSCPSSRRFGHPAMQYFSRLTNTTVESNDKDEVVYDPLRLDRYIGRKLYYIENANNFVQAMEIGLALWVEETVFSQYQSMKLPRMHMSRVNLFRLDVKLI